MRTLFILTAVLTFTAIASAQAFSGELADMDADAQMACFVKNRQALADDPYRPLYHFSPPGLGTHDAAGLCWWQGKYHLSPEVASRTPEIGPLYLEDGEPLRLRVFIDRSIIEVFANGRQCLTLRAYPVRPDSTGVSVFARGSEAGLVSLTAYQMKTIWPELKAKEGR